jgi:hypothetical protein
MNRWLLAVLAASLLATSVADCEDLSGRWRIDYFVENGSPPGGLAEVGVASLSENDGTLGGRATLGSRGDGYLIGCRKGSTIRLAITFRHHPTFFVWLVGSLSEGELQGSFGASFSQGGFWQGGWRAIQLTTASGDVINADAGGEPVSFTPTDEDMRPKPIRYLDPEANWSVQQETGIRETFVISNDKDTLLICRNKAFIWEWWL